MVYPFVILLHKFGFSYKWINVSRSAWVHPTNDFQLLWHYQWFGNPIEHMPPQVILNGILYRVIVAEGLVIFKCDSGMLPIKFHFYRDPYCDSFLWVTEVRGPFPACHFESAYDWIKAVYGGPHSVKKLPIKEKNVITTEIKEN